MVEPSGEFRERFDDEHGMKVIDRLHPVKVAERSFKPSNGLLSA